MKIISLNNGKKLNVEKKETYRYLGYHFGGEVPLDDELEKMGAGALRRAAKEGDVKTGSLMCGQIAGLVNSENTCKEIIESVCGECEKLLKGAEGWVK